MVYYYLFAEKISWNLISQALDFLKTSSEAASSSNLLGSIKKRAVPLDPVTIQTSTPLPGRKMLLQANQVRKLRKIRYQILFNFHRVSLEKL